MTINVGDKVLLFPDGKGGYTAYEISAPAVGEKCILIPDGKGGYIAVGTGAPEAGGKVPVVPDGKGGYITWKAGTPTPILYFIKQSSGNLVLTSLFVDYTTSATTIRSEGDATYYSYDVDDLNNLHLLWCHNNNSPVYYGKYNLNTSAWTIEEQETDIPPYEDGETIFYSFELAASDTRLCNYQVRADEVGSYHTRVFDCGIDSPDDWTQRYNNIGTASAYSTRLKYTNDDLFCVISSLPWLGNNTKLFYESSAGTWTSHSLTYTNGEKGLASNFDINNSGELYFVFDYDKPNPTDPWKVYLTHISPGTSACPVDKTLGDTVAGDFHWFKGTLKFYDNKTDYCYIAWGSSMNLLYGKYIDGAYTNTYYSSLGPSSIDPKLPFLLSDKTKGNDVYGYCNYNGFLFKNGYIATTLTTNLGYLFCKKQ